MAKKSSANTVAYAAPFVTFMIFTGLCGLLEWAHIRPGGVAGMYVMYPLQTVAGAGVVGWYWRVYRLRAPRKGWLAAAVGVVVFALWVSPQAVFHHAARLDGFDPGVFAGRPGLYWAGVVARFARLVVVVPALEEIFWRGLLLRFLINEEFEAVPFGTYARMANAVVAIGFMLEHSYADWPAALVTGLAYNFVAYRTKSLSSCILTHAVTNALLGAYIMHTGQWGFW
jgi:CAAX prenyl protease-like protein